MELRTYGNFGQAIMTVIGLVRGIEDKVKLADEKGIPNKYTFIHNFPTAYIDNLSRDVSDFSQPNNIFSWPLDPVIGIEMTRRTEEMKDFITQFNGEFGNLNHALPDKTPVYTQLNNHMSAINGCLEGLNYLVNHARLWLKLSQMVDSPAVLSQLVSSMSSTRDRFSEESTAMLHEFNDNAKDLVRRMELKVTDKDIVEIKGYFDTELKKKRKSFRWMSFAFYLSFTVTVSSFLIFGLYHLRSRDFQEIDTFTKAGAYVLFASIAGFLIFLTTDFRKRANIVRTIIDELEQKTVLTDTYSVLLEKAKATTHREDFEKDLLKNIVESLLEVRNHGFSGKDMQNHSPNPIVDILNKALDKLPK